MSNQCLVTRIKGVVNNENLPYFEKLKFQVQVDDASKYIVLASNPNQDVEVYKNNSLVDTTTIYSTSTRVNFDSTGIYEVVIPKKYNLTRFDASAFQMAETFDLKNIKNCPINYFKVKGEQTVIGEIKDFPTVATVVDINSCKNVTGDLTDISSQIEEVGFDRNTVITGSINNMPDNIISIRAEGSRISGELVTLAEHRCAINKLTPIFVRAGGTIKYNGRDAGVVNYNITFNSTTEFTITTNRAGYPTVKGTYSNDVWNIEEIE